MKESNYEVFGKKSRDYKEKNKELTYLQYITKNSNSLIQK